MIALLMREPFTDLVLLHNTRDSDSSDREGYSQSTEIQGDRTTFKHARIRDGV